MAASLDLFSKYGTSVGVDRVIAQAGVARATFYRHFPSKEDLVVAFLADRELLWLQRLEGSLGEAVTAGDRLLAVFDALDAWFQREDFEGSSIIRALMDSHGSPGRVTEASLAGMGRLRDALAKLASAAGATDPDNLARTWDILAKGAIVAAMEGDKLAARRAKTVGGLLLRIEKVTFSASGSPLGGGSARIA